MRGIGTRFGTQGLSIGHGSARSRERGRYRPEQAPVGVGELGSVDLPAQHSELVAQHDDLDVLPAA